MTRKKNTQPKPKMTKEQRREKYTKLARDRKDRSIARAVGRTQTCFACRQRGHSLAFCPNKDKLHAAASKICYKCGSKDHALSACPDYKPSDTDLPFATCFVCHRTGHLASQCVQNEKGVFPNGGECKRCGSNQHVSSKCPTKETTTTKRKNSVDEIDVNELLEGGRDDLKPLESTKNEKNKTGSAKKRRVVNF